MFIGELFKSKESDKIYKIVYKLDSYYLFALNDEVKQDERFTQYIIKENGEKVNLDDLGIKEYIIFYVEDNYEKIKELKKYTTSINSREKKLERLINK